MQCATASNISWKSIQECFSSGQADELLVENGKRTDAVEPKITFIPTIVYNDIFSAALQNLSLTNFLNVVQFISDEEECGGCHLNGSNRMATIDVVVLSLSFLLICKQIV
ncbi:hypothetical protein NQ314_004417 [Rhamnusium bicolor]|uniref:Uncharacterized protein n=1 Tax=Rhamnusium bicolor TaxID=1586634 RepID=A0AAV8ZMK1_9CUCU|nr:hypothetical protein NQ314_004417 [Rhamnusium bicolor]